jgi:hypothetical protein
VSDWAVGDLAVCVDVSPREGNPAGGGKHLTLGAPYRVDGVALNKNAKPVLILCGVAGVWRTDRFRKILPDRHEACETEFVDLLKRIKRPVSA